MASPRGLQQALADLLASLKTPTGTLGPATTAHPAAGPHITTTTTTSGALTVRPGSLSSTLAGLPPPLTPAEQQELESLRADYRRDIKLAKLNIFKALPSTIRQSVIDAFEWENARHQMNTASLSVQNPRLKELEDRDSFGRIFGGQSHSSYFRQYMGSPYQTLDTANNIAAFSGFILPEGISLEDLKITHIEATMEESIQNESTNT